MKLLISTIATVLVAGCTTLAQQSSPPTEAKRAEPATEAAITSEALLKAQTDYDAAHYREVLAVTAAEQAMLIYGKTKQYGKSQMWLRIRGSQKFVAIWSWLRPN